ADEESQRPSTSPLFDLVRRGWNLAFERLSSRAAGVLLLPADTLARGCEGLPHTLVHGDAKVANFGFLPGGQVAAFDWEMTGVAPSGIDLGYYLAVNAGRLARPKAEVAARYRAL